MRRSARATCRCSSPGCRSSRAPITPSSRSRNRRSTCRSAAAPYKVGRFEPGRYIEYERVKDWWGADLPVVRGQNNFDTLRYEYYRDRDVGFEGFTAKSYLFREEFTSRIWATRYDFPAIRDGRVKREVLPDDTPSGAQGWFINTRRDKFKDPEAARGADLRLRLRMDQQEHHVRVLRADPFGVPELRHDGERQAGAGGAGAARAVPRQGAGRGVRRAVRAAGVRRLGPGPRAAARGARSCCTRPATPIKDGKRVHAERRALDDRVPDRRAVVPAAPHALHQEPRPRSASTRSSASSMRRRCSSG